MDTKIANQFYFLVNKLEQQNLERELHRVELAELIEYFGRELRNNYCPDRFDHKVIYDYVTNGIQYIDKDFDTVENAYRACCIMIINANERN